MTEAADVLVAGAARLVTFAGPPRARRGAEMRRTGELRDAGVAIVRGRIAEVGPWRRIRRRWRARRIVDASGCLVTPGLVDAHTHLVWAGDRAREFAMRCEGRSYQQIARAGGGILSTVRATRRASERALLRTAQRRLDEMVAHGTTTVEVKSGYGLEWRTERRQLRTALRLRGARIVPTFLGAHTVPPEYRHRRRAFLDVVIRMLPRAARLARFCDVFCDVGAFTRAEAHRVLKAGLAHGLQPKIHADEFANLGATEMACALGAVSADHLGKVGRRGIEALARSSTVAVLLPATSTFLDLEPAPARRLIEAGAAVALGTDYNPGSSHAGNMQLVLTLACVRCRMTPEEALCAATINAAASCGMAHVCGSLEPGRGADLVVWDVPAVEALPYVFGFNRARVVIVQGRVVAGGLAY